MLSDKEKKAIERLNKRYEFFKENPLATNVWLTLDIHSLGIVLNLIEKQSKEIEKLINANDNLKKTKRIKNMEYVNQNYVSKDKIKAKIEELDKQKAKNEIWTYTDANINKSNLYCLSLYTEHHIVPKINELVKAVNQIRKDFKK